jgi:CRISPR-associated protein (TIGR03986 family)
MAVTAPFRFARIPRKVYTPAWGQLVSHDVPFKDGISGEIGLEIIARSPLIVGGARGKPPQDDATEVWPCTTPDGTKWTIPGSTLQGMVRSILEVAAFGKLGPNVANQRFGLRDISGSATGKALYQPRVTTGRGTRDDPFRPLPQPGWLVRRRDGTKWVVRCHTARPHGNRILALCGAAQDSQLDHVLKSRSDAEKRSKAILGARKAATHAGSPGLECHALLGGEQPHLHNRPWGPQYIKYEKCILTATAQPASVPVTLVMTGKSAAGYGSGQKKREFAFYGPARPAVAAATDLEAAFGGKVLPVTSRAWADFMLIHEPDTGRNAARNPNWDYWKPEFEAGNPVPIFYLEEKGEVVALGTAQMFKLAMSLSSHDALAHSSADHVTEAGDYDLPSLIFGGTGGEKGQPFRHNLRRRAAFDTATGPIVRLDPPPNDSAGRAGTFETAMGPDVRPDHRHRIDGRDPDVRILMSPKPSYFPIYVRQVPGQRAHELSFRDTPRGRQWAPYCGFEPVEERGDGYGRPELAGVKIWPAAGQGALRPKQEPPKATDRIRTRLNTLAPGATFTTTLRFHNLRPAELGAILWALTFGDKAALQGGETPLRHRLGMGKPYGAGEVEIRINGVALRANSGEADLDAKALVDRFQALMEKQVQNWGGSPQVAALQQAADPGRNAANDLTYMPLGGGKDPPAGTYLGERRGNRFLPTYGSPQHESRRRIAPPRLGTLPAGTLRRRRRRRRPPLATSSRRAWATPCADLVITSG